MQEPDEPADTDPIGRDHRAAIVERLYDVALDPIRLEDLIDVMEGSLAPLRIGLPEGATLDDPELQAHLQRASVFLDRYEATRTEGDHRPILEQIRRAAAFITDGGPEIVASNRAAMIRFGLPERAGLADLPFELDDCQTLREAVLRIASGRSQKTITLRFRSTRAAGPVILRVSRIEAAERPLALVLSTEFAWPEGFEMTLRDTLALTWAETEVVRALSEGQQVRDIAKARRRSQETVRTQIRSILAKTEAHSQSELVRMVLGLMDMATVLGPTPCAPAQQDGADRVEASLLTLPDGRHLEVLQFGAAEGAALLYMHLDYALTRWPAQAERTARERGIRVIVPVRAGYGRSSPLPAGDDRTLICAKDYACVLDHLALSRATVICQGADLRFALQLSLARPDLVAGIIGCAAQLPLRTAAQYERMDKWQRVILANARYAPKLLPFMVKAAFSLARRMGKERFFEMVNGGSRADIETFAIPEVRKAMLEGSDAILGPDAGAVDAFAQECISSERDWSHLVRAAKVPVLLLQGDQDPQTPVATVRELMTDFPAVEVRFLPGNGQLLFFREWARVLDESERFLVRGAEAARRSELTTLD